VVSGNRRSFFWNASLFFVGVSPDLSFLGCLDEVIPEIGMGNGYQFFRAIPGWTGFQGYAAILGYNVVNHLAGDGGNGADIKIRNDPGHN
jgi:hypothetical protein